MAVVVTAALLVWHRSAGSGDRADAHDAPAHAAGGSGIGHVHALAVNPGDGGLYVASHTGLYRLAGHQPLHRVGDRQPDLMGFAVAGPNHFLASGHPDPRDGGPHNLGLIESTDAGRTWRTLALGGDADFHALTVTGDRTYGYESHGRTLYTSTDRRSWDTVAVPAVRSLAGHPQHPEVLIAAASAAIVMSVDGGGTWNPVPGAPAATLVAWGAADQLWAVDAAGNVHQSADQAASWTATGAVTGAVDAVGANGTELYVALRAGDIVSSADGGRTWSARHTPSS
ncbi:glycosyl hydrolase [Dactylosporangium sp. AC04546]|uniref:F510_1955 family glycosylhydrolase n=1 Tax=Dactylosporangium sp. AC04546 TaxID=2862460 RepID=UPI001EDE416C|nr:glycosyl hydrolase [Dactylosporangium sp. AC04546]WVK86767.1 glycosyl hydrolase [Dactylosporangium sp. AC04546]